MLLPSGSVQRSARRRTAPSSLRLRLELVPDAVPGVNEVVAGRPVIDLLVATTNEGKFAEVKAFLREFPLQLVSLKTVAAARLMGADCIISGIRPQIAQTIVHLGVDLNTVTTKATLKDALSVALRRTGLAVTSGRSTPAGAAALPAPTPADQ